MPTFYKDECYQATNSSTAYLTFHLDEHRRRAFNTNQLISFALDPHPAADSDKNAPPQKLSLQFATADVIILGWRLDRLIERLVENRLSALGVLPKRYAHLDREKVFVAEIKITPIENTNS
jgi:hypothetical protein